ncbi:alpha/beta hydrolase-fold protein [Maricaulis sp.]|uniref:alpha/beta hydrolase n=1 Tax=Maricaulis sp. TaxID=1486257 RepID=UPI0025C12C77|nr:alpha/beta hydrolase-fold protein [Maricaulis sp.]
MRHLLSPGQLFPAMLSPAMLSLALLVLFTPAITAQPDAGEVIRLEPMGADGLEARPISVYLPPGYAEGVQAYPVIYAMDGQNLFEPGYSFAGVEWGLDETMDRLIAEGRIRPAIIVGIWNTPSRALEYAPRAVFDRLPAAAQAQAMESWGDAVLSDVFLRFLVEDIKPLIDSRYRTRPEAAETALMGSSMGGLISFYGLARHSETFGAAAGLSTHWPIFADGSFRDPQIAGAWREQALAAWSDFLADAPLDPTRHRIWLDHGTINLDGLYPPYQDAIDAVMAGRGFDDSARYRSTRYEGADHNETAWNARLADPLVFLLGVGQPD